MSALGGQVSALGGQVSALGGGQEEGPGIRPVNCHITCSGGGGCLELGAMGSRGPSEVVRHGSLCGDRPAHLAPAWRAAQTSERQGPWAPVMEPSEEPAPWGLCPRPGPSRVSIGH